MLLDDIIAYTLIEIQHISKTDHHENPLQFGDGFALNNSIIYSIGINSLHATVLSEESRSNQHGLYHIKTYHVHLVTSVTDQLQLYVTISFYKFSGSVFKISSGVRALQRRQCLQCISMPNGILYV